MYSFPDLEPVFFPCPVLTVASWPAYRLLRRQVRWSGIPISFPVCCDPQNFPVCYDPHKGFSIVNEADVFLELSYFFCDPMLVIWSLVPLPFLRPAWTSGSSRFTNCWSLAWRILSITFSCVRWVLLCGSLSILWHCLSLGLEWKLTFSSPVCTAEFFNFAGILSTALSQHHLLGFEIAQLEFHHLH